MVKITLKEINIYLNNKTLETITNMFNNENGIVVNQFIETLAEIGIEEHIENNLNKIIKN